MLEPSSVDCVIYHANCTDGFGSAFSAWKLLGNRAEYYACGHGDKPPNVKGKNVVILDFSDFLILISSSFAKIFNNEGKSKKVTIKEINKPKVIIHPKSIIGFIPLNIRDKKANIVVNTV